MSKEKVVISLFKPTPEWCTWTFRIVLILTTAIWFIVSGDDGIAAETKNRVANWIKGIDFIVWSLSRFMGVDNSIKPDTDYPNKQ